MTSRTVRRSTGLLDGAPGPLAQLGGRRGVQRADQLDCQDLLGKGPREPWRCGNLAQMGQTALRCERSIGQSGQLAVDPARHRSTTGSVAVIAVPRRWLVSLTNAMSRTGTGVAMPQVPLISLNGGRVTVLPERVTTCSL